MTPGDRDKLDCYCRQLETEVRYYKMRLAEFEDLKTKTLKMAEYIILHNNPGADATITEALRIVDER